MNEFQKYSNSEKITHMLDGELSKSESLEMQKLVESDPELKAQMDEELKIREAIGRDSESFKPPFAATAAIFGAIGIDLAILTGAGSQTIGFWAKMISQKAFWPAVSATVATLVTTVSIWFGVFSDEEIPKESQKEITKDKIIDESIETNKTEVKAEDEEEISSVPENNMMALKSDKDNIGKTNIQTTHKNSSPGLKSNNSGVAFTASLVPEPLASEGNILNIPDIIISFSKLSPVNDSFNFLSGYDDSFIFNNKKSPRISSGLGGNSFGIILKSEGNLSNYSLGASFGSKSLSNYNLYFNGIYSFGNFFDASAYGASFYGLVGTELNIAHFEYGVPILELGYGLSNSGGFGYGGIGFKMFLPDGFLFGSDLNIDLKIESKFINSNQNIYGFTFGINLIF